MNPQYQQQNDPFNSSTMATSVAQSPVEVRMNFIRKTYVLFMAGILMCVLAGAACLSVPSLYGVAMTILKMPLLALLLIVGGSFAATAVSQIEGLNYVALFSFTGLMGFIFAPLIAMFAPTVVGQAAFLTILMFGALTAYVFVTKKDFSFLGGMLFVGLVALILGGLANVFLFRNSGADYWMAWITLFLFERLRALQNLEHPASRYGENDATACAAALALFIRFHQHFHVAAPHSRRTTLRTCEYSHIIPKRADFFNPRALFCARLCSRL